MLEAVRALTGKQWRVLIGLLGINLGCGAGSSVQASFYPKEAEKRGVSASEYGMVFGIFELVAFIAYPIIGKYLGRLGASPFIRYGAVLCGLSIVAFGFLGFVNDHLTFIGVSYTLRVVEAVGTAAVVSASVTVVVSTYSTSYATVLAMVDSMEALGYIIAPTIGGYLFEVGGFYCPFIVLGSFVILNGVLLVTNIDDKMEDVTDEPCASLISALKILPVSLAAFAMMVEAITMGFLTATLEPHLRKFNLSPTIVGALFIISGIVYALCSPLVGYMCDKKLNTKVMVTAGSVFSIISFSLIGPLPFTPWELSFPLLYIGLGMYGIGMSLIYVPAFMDAANSAVKYGLPDDMNTYGLVSGMYGSAVALGAFIGPAAAGVLFDTVGFREGTLFVIAAQSTLFVAMTCFLCFEKHYRNKS